MNDSQKTDNALLELIEAREQIKVLNERISLLAEIGSGLCELVEAQTPTKNCSCHICPPCNDCVDHGHTRELVEHWNRFNL